MRTLITGAGGFVGSALLKRLIEQSNPEDAIVATDVDFPNQPEATSVRQVVGDLTAPGFIDDLFDAPFDRIFHLATVAGVGSAADFVGGKRMNLDATLALLEAVRQQGRAPRLVYSSSVGVIGATNGVTVTDDTLPQPKNSYGTHKLVGELLVNDYTRAGLVDGLALRLPGIVARPAGSSTMLSAFVNDVFYAARDGRQFALPLAPDDGTWLMSVGVCTDNLLYAAQLSPAALPARRNWSLPATRITMADLRTALADYYGSHVLECISFRPVESAQKMFAQGPLVASGAIELGFKGDGSADALVANVVAREPNLRKVT